MASIPIWDGSGDDFAWDALILGGEFMPGVPTVKCDVENSLDKKKPSGAQGAKISDEGQEPAQISISLQLINEGDLAALARVLPKIRPPRKGGKRDPLAIVHPNPNILGVESVVIETISMPQPSAADGWVISIGAVEWVPEPKKQEALAPVKQKQPATLQDLNAQIPSANGVDVNLIPDFVTFTG
jgi:hypothetical protein